MASALTIAAFEASAADAASATSSASPPDLIPSDADTDYSDDAEFKSDRLLASLHAILSAPHPSSDFVRIGSGSAGPFPDGPVQSQSLHIARAILSFSLLRSGP